jgi:hypothetical protein
MAKQAGIGGIKKAPHVRGAFKNGLERLLFFHLISIVIGIVQEQSHFVFTGWITFNIIATFF